MNFAKITLGLLAVTLLVAAPGSTFAGHGLLDGGCGCATQKGGHIAQKGHVVQKGYVHQKGEIVQKGGVAQKGCGSSCGSCSTCLPRVLPALLHGIDSVLNAVFCCDSCGSKSGCGCATQKGHVMQKGHIVQKGHVSQKGSSCGCGESHSGPGNPFIDDLQPPPVIDGDADARFRVRRDNTRPVSQSIETPARTVVKTASSTSREPRQLPAELVSPIEQIREARTSLQPTPAAVVRTSATTATGLVVPKNPLR